MTHSSEFQRPLGSGFAAASTADEVLAAASTRTVGTTRKEHSMELNDSAKDPSTYAAGLPVTDPEPVYSYHPVLIDVPGRPVSLAVRVTAPAVGSDLPVIVLSHGHGPSTFVSSFYGYGPLVNFWAAHGFVVLQPTHLDATFLGLREAEDPDAPLYLTSRADDLRQVVDHLGEIERAVPGLAGRLDTGRIAAVGHSAGGHTVGLISGQTITDTSDGSTVGAVDARFSARVMIAAPGCGEDLNGLAAQPYVALTSTNFDGMTPKVLIVVGEKDWHPFFSNRQDWRSDPYTAAPGPKTRLEIFDAEHGLGGISTFDAAETTDENPDRVAAVRALIWAYLRSELYPEDPAWTRAIAALADSTTPIGRVESK
ncbi:alpha/beta hydrolase family protein [Micromonospora sp. DT201]|uniref:alpha/beta hydrolase family protein n=1 Tax=Micromonospora sp. DT201 TaxID=3393442 RepID=UPI003CEF50B5